MKVECSVRQLAIVCLQAVAVGDAMRKKTEGFWPRALPIKSPVSSWVFAHRNSNVVERTRISLFPYDSDPIDRQSPDETDYA